MIGSRAAELFAYRASVRNLLAKDLKLKYRGSALGVAWSLLLPLGTLGVFTLAFRYVLRVPMQQYPYFLLVGLLPWNFFAGAALASTTSITGNAHLLKHVNFPREVLPVATVLFHFAQLLLGLTVLVPALVLVSDASVPATVAALPVVLLLHLCFTVGVAFILSALTAAFRDVTHLAEVGLPLLFWLTPIAYPATLVPAPLDVLVSLNPAAGLALAYQDLLFWGRWPGLRSLLGVAGWTVAVLVVGHAIFRARSRAFAEET